MTRKTSSAIRKILMTVTLAVIMGAVGAFAQSERSYDFGLGGGGIGGGADGVTGLLDPSRFSVNHSMSFFAGGTGASDIKSQSIYSTMFQYKFSAPVVLSLNFDMPIHSTFNQYSNFTTDNLQSLDYFRNIPIDAAVTWMPSERFALGLRVVKMPESGYYNSYQNRFRHDNFFFGRDDRFFRDR